MQRAQEIEARPSAGERLGGMTEDDLFGRSLVITLSAMCRKDAPTHIWERLRYFPMQNAEKMRPSKSSAEMRPEMPLKASRASRSSNAMNSGPAPTWVAARPKAARPSAIA